MTLLCPRNKTPLKTLEIDGIQVDACPVCAGVWFDNFELKKMDEISENAGDTLIEKLKEFQNSAIDQTQKLKCPKCKDSGLFRSHYSPKQSFEIDTCYTCGGVWLDAGELIKVREQFKTDDERSKFLQEFAESASQTPFQEEREKTTQDLARAKAIAHALRFISPSYYKRRK